MRVVEKRLGALGSPSFASGCREKEKEYKKETTTVKTMTEQDNATPPKRRRRRYPYIVTLADCAKRETYDNDQDRIWAAWDLYRHWLVFWAFRDILAVPALSDMPLFITQECVCDAGTSLINGFVGSYKAGLWALRSLLGLTLTAILFDRDQSHLQRYEETDKTPRWKQLLKVLDYDCFSDYRSFLRQRGMRRLAKWASKRQTNKLYHDILSQAAHSHIERWSYLDWNRFIAPEYRPSGFRRWYRIFKTVNERCLLFLCLAFPRAYHYALAEYDQSGQSFDDLFSFWQRRYLAIKCGTTQ